MLLSLPKYTITGSHRHKRPQLTAFTKSSIALPLSRLWCFPLFFAFSVLMVSWYWPCWTSTSSAAMQGSTSLITPFTWPSTSSTSFSLSSWFSLPPFSPQTLRFLSTRTGCLAAGPICVPAFCFLSVSSLWQLLSYDVDHRSQPSPQKWLQPLPLPLLVLLGQSAAKGCTWYTLTSTAPQSHIREVETLPNLSHLCSPHQ